MIADLDKLIFLSTVNYMKRDSTCGTDTLTLGALYATTPKTVDHNLNYIPFFEVYCDFSGDGVLWAGEKVGEYTESSLSVTLEAWPILERWITTTTLTMNLINSTSPTATGTRDIYWLIYLDYGNE
jgi:hypothetical protein